MLPRFERFRASPSMLFFGIPRDAIEPRFRALNHELSEKPNRP
jgi:hypothetical protein